MRVTKAVSYPINDRFITSNVEEIVDAIYVTSILTLLVFVLSTCSSNRNEISLRISFLVLFIVLYPILWSYLTFGYVLLSSVIISFLLCMYTVIVIVLSRFTIGRLFKTNPDKFKQGKLNLIYYEYTVIDILLLM